MQFSRSAGHPRAFMPLTICVLAILCSTQAAAAREPAVHEKSDRRWEMAIAESRTALAAFMQGRKAPAVSVAVCVENDLVWAEAAGLADIENNRLATTATRFGLGSISKTLTMAAAVRLSERGAFDLDAPIENYLPDFPHKGRGVTARRIAVHQSGLSDEPDRRLFETTTHCDDLAAALRLIEPMTLDFEPGTRSVYATAAHTYIGRALERAGAKPYADLVRELILDPRRLSSFAPLDARSIPPDLARFYVKADDGSFKPGPRFDPSYKLPGAGWIGTAGDLARLGAALVDPAFLSNTARAQLFTAVATSDGQPTEFALGLRVANDEAAGTVLHQPGGGIGISCWLFVYPKQRLSIALMCNVTGGPVAGKLQEATTNAFLQSIQPDGRSQSTKP